MANMSNPVFLVNIYNYLALPETDKAPINEVYEQEVISKLVVMETNVDKVQLDLEEHLKISTWTNNQYLTTIAKALAHMLSYKTDNKKQSQKQGK